MVTCENFSFKLSEINSMSQNGNKISKHVLMIIIAYMTTSRIQKYIQFSVF